MTQDEAGAEIEFATAFKALTDNPPFPWQVELFNRLCRGSDSIPSRCDIPTGLGKTSVIAIWLLARQKNPKLPRRLVYVVNRRTVVDQTTDEVEKIRRNLPQIGRANESLAISTLRGQFADNREWSADPSREAVICGTVDMIGSRLLFSGYGVGFKGKPLHAGFLGQDSLIVHDEAHLEPAFQKLLVAIEEEQREGRFPDQQPLRVMELSATSRGQNTKKSETPLTLSDADRSHSEVIRRINAKKSLHLTPQADAKPGAQLAKLAIDKFKDSGAAILIFTRTIDDVKAITETLSKAKLPSEQLIGPMRGLERDRLADPKNDKGSAIFARFLPPQKADVPPSEKWKVTPMAGTVYLVCTSAGEVGVNISADHLVCDLSTFESMAQRFGRVNRFGLCDDTEIHVVYPTTFDDKAPNPQRKKTLALLEQLNGDASPDALSKLPETSRAEAFAPMPTILETSDILFDAWSMTSILGHMPGRPKVEPFLHGITEWEPPQTKIAWRDEVGEITGDLLSEYPPDKLLESYPLKSHELLTDRSDRVLKTLTSLKLDPNTPIWIVDDEGGVSVKQFSYFAEVDKDEIADVTLLLPPEAGGLENGCFASVPQNTTENYDVSGEWRHNLDAMRERTWQRDKEGTPITPAGMKHVERIAFPDPTDEDAKPLKIWHWFVRVLAADPDARSSKKSYDLLPHLTDAKEAAARIVADLSLEPDLRDAVILAAAFHDLGKEREKWQRAIGNMGYPQDSKAWAKSGKGAGRGERIAYRHEFGSMLDAQLEAEFKKLPPEMQDLALHLIAAHHGRGRPHFTVSESLDDKHNTEDAGALAMETPRRFARLQRKYGRWGLAYLESLVRAADYEASRKVEGGAK